MPKLLFQTPLDVPQLDATNPAGARGRSPEEEFRELRRALGGPLAALASLPFADGNLFQGAELPGIRGQVHLIDGAELFLVNPDTLENFRVYEPDIPPGSSIVYTTPPEIPSSRVGTVQIAGLERRVETTPTGYAYRSVLISGSGNWEDAIPGIAAGDYLYGTDDSGFIAPGVPSRGAFDDKSPTGAFHGPVVQLLAGFRSRAHIPSGVLVLRAQIQPAQVWWLGDLGYPLKRKYVGERGRNVVSLASKYACRADLWVF